MTNKEIRQAAKSDLRGRWAGPVFSGLIYCGIIMIFYIPMYVIILKNTSSYVYNPLYWIFYALIILAEIPLSIGLYSAIARFCRRCKDGSDNNCGRTIKDMFVLGFGKNLLSKYATMLLYSIIIVIGFFLLIVPGIILSINYALAPFLLTDEPELGPIGTLKKSRKMMKGYRMRFFLMCLGFLGLLLGGILTLCISYIWLLPFIIAGYSNFYEEVRQHYAEQAAVSA